MTILSATRWSQRRGRLRCLLQEKGGRSDWRWARVGELWESAPVLIPCTTDQAKRLGRCAGSREGDREEKRRSACLQMSELSEEVCREAKLRREISSVRGRLGRERKGRRVRSGRGLYRRGFRAGGGRVFGQGMMDGWQGRRARPGHRLEVDGEPDR
jgi:hypothetical protein